MKKMDDTPRCSNEIFQVLQQRRTQRRNDDNNSKTKQQRHERDDRRQREESNERGTKLQAAYYQLITSSLHFIISSNLTPIQATKEFLPSR